jgi:hypothetical protein
MFRRSDQTTDWLLVAGMTMLILFVQRRLRAGEFGTLSPRKARPAPLTAGEIAEPSRERHCDPAVGTAC